MLSSYINNNRLFNLT